MAYNNFGLGSGYSAGVSSGEKFIFKANGQDITLPESSYIRDADMTRSGMDLLLKTQTGQVVIENYFAVETPPSLIGPDHTILTPKLVNSFMKSNPVYASNASMTDESPVGLVSEMEGGATVTRVDGSTETLRMGTPVYQGDIIETSGKGAVNITFTDESSFAISENARLAIDEYVFDPSAEGGKTDFSVLKGMFVYTSGIIGREDPDDVMIETPVGSIGIRGTIIAGNVDNGEITVVEGAIVLRDFDGYEVTLANQFETAKFDLDGRGIEHLGELSASDVAGKFASVSHVAPTLFSSIQDSAATEQNNNSGSPETNGAPPEAGAQGSEKDNSGAEGSDSSQKSSGEQSGDATTSTESAQGEKTATETKSEAAVETVQADQQSNVITTSGTNTATVETKTAVKSPAISTSTTTNETKSAYTTTETTRTTTTTQSTTTATQEKVPQYVPPTTTTQTSTSPTTTEPLPTAPKPVATNFELPQGYGFIAKQAGAQATGVFRLDLSQLFKGANQYALDSATIETLNGLVGSVLEAHYFNTQTGILELTLKDQSAWNSFDGFISGLYDIDITVNGSSSGGITSQSLSIKAYDGADYLSAQNVNTNNVGNIIYGTASSASPNNIAVVGTKAGTTVFLEDSISTISLDNLQNATVFTGNGNNVIHAGGTSANNTIIGGKDVDTFNLNSVKNDVYGMDGNDTVRLAMNNINQGYGKTIDGGRGHDALILFTAHEYDSIDFGNSNTLFKNFEEIKLSGVGMRIENLSLEDVISMTDDRNNLRISLEGGEGEVALDSGFEITQSNVNGYDVWTGTSSGQTVTLFIDTDISVTAA